MLIGCPFEIFHIVRYIMMLQRYWFLVDSARRLVFLWHFVWCFCGVLFGVFVAIRLVFLWQFVWCFCAVRYSVWVAAAAQVQDRTASQVQAYAFSKMSKQRSQNENVKRYNVKTATRTRVRKGS